MEDSDFWALLLLIGGLIYLAGVTAKRITQLEQDVDYLMLAGVSPSAVAAARQLAGLSVDDKEGGGP
jgi:hypothetical protein